MSDHMSRDLFRGDVHEGFKIVVEGQELRFPVLRLLAIVVSSVVMGFLIGIKFAHAESATDRWEHSLLTMKHNGTLLGPRPSQKCLYSKTLGSCLWYTPGKWWGMPK